MISAIEIYNKPDFLYRGRLLPYWQLMVMGYYLKAKYLSINNNNIRSLYIYDKRKNKKMDLLQKANPKKTKELGNL